MIGNTLLEFFGHIIFSFTRSVAEHYNPEEPEYSSESFGYNPLHSTGLEWYCQPGDELIYQEYSDRQTTSVEYPASSSLCPRLIDACSTQENDDIQPIHEDRSMAWKRLRPSMFRTLWNSLCIGALISLLTAIIIGAIYIGVTFLSYKIKHNCEFQQRQSIPINVQWTRTISGAISAFFIHLWYLVNTFLVFQPFQLQGIKGRLSLVCFGVYCLDVAYRIALQILGISYSHLTHLESLPLNVLFSTSISVQAYIVARHFCMTPTRKKITLFFQLTLPGVSSFIGADAIAYLLYPAYNRQNEEGKLVIAVFAPLMAVVLKAMSRICAQRLWNIAHPGTSFVLLAPLYCGSAVMFRILQADLDSLESIAILGVIHGAVEVIERSTMVLRDHIYHQICERKSAPWGSFRTPRRERLAADTAIMSMVFESSAVVSVNGLLYLYQFIYLRNNSDLKLLQSFAINTSVPLVIEWFFTSVSLAIETRYQNMPVMAVWRRRWRRHILVAIINVVPVAVWTSTNLLIIVHGRFSYSANKPCKMPFT